MGTLKYRDAAGNVKVVGGGSDTLPVGSCMFYPFPGGAPEGWLPMEGQIFNRVDYPALADATGAGSTAITFTLPDMRGRVPVGQQVGDADFNNVGQTGGEKTHLLTVNELAAHSHGASKIARGFINGEYNVSDNSRGSDWETSLTGEDQPHNNLQPYLVGRWIVKAYQSTMPEEAGKIIDSAAADRTDCAMSQRAAKAYTDSKQDLCSVTGQLLQVETVAAGVPALAIAGKTYQDGTPAPDDPAMIHGAGENGGIELDVNGKVITYPLSAPLYDGDHLLPNGKIIRKKKKLILTGEESYSFNDPSISQTLCYLTNMPMVNSICSHFSNIEYIDLGRTEQGINTSNHNNVWYIEFRTIANNINEFKSWLAAQYAAGTPVTVIYELTDPENEYTAPDQIPELQAGQNIVQDNGIYSADLTLYYSKSGMPVFNQNTETDWVTLWVNPNQSLGRIAYKVKSGIVYFNVYEYPISSDPYTWININITLPETIRPHYNVRGVASTYSNSDFVGQFVLGADGSILLSSPQAPVSLYFFASWPL